MAKTAVFGLVNDEAEASDVVEGLQAAGFSSEEVSMLFPDKSGRGTSGPEKKTKAPEGTGTGVGTGLVMGGALGWVAGIGALAIPGAGPFIAAGPLMAALSGAAVGAAVGGITGALIGMGIPEIEARRYEGRVREGSILISVHTEDAEQAQHARDILEHGGAEDISIAEEASVKPNAPPRVRVRLATVKTPAKENEAA